MSSFFHDYDKNSTYDITVKQQFDIGLNNFLSFNRNFYVNFNEEFQHIENFLSYQPTIFFEETFLTTCAKIIQRLGASDQDDKQVAFAHTFVSMIKKEKFKNLLPQLQNYGTNNNFSFIYFLLTNNHISLAENITNAFIHPEKRTLKNFNTNIIDWCLKNTKIAALQFLLNHYDGFNDSTIQSLFLNYGELGDQYLTKVFPNHHYPHGIERNFQSFFNNSSIVLTKKLQLISYFCKKIDFVPIELASYINNGLNNYSISVDSLKEFDFYNKLSSVKTINTFLPYSNSKYLPQLHNYLSFFIKKEDIPTFAFEILLDHPKSIFPQLLKEFIQFFPEISQEKSKDIQAHITKNDIDVNYDVLTQMNKSFVLEDTFVDYALNKSKDLYFCIKNPQNDSQFIKKTIDYILENKKFPSFLTTNIQEVVTQLSNQLNNEQLVDLFFKNSYITHNFHFLTKTNAQIVMDLTTLSLSDKEELAYNLSGIFPRSELEKLKPKKWYQLSSEKPLQLVLKNSSLSMITNDNDLVEIINKEIILDNISNTSISVILSQAKKDLSKFQQLTSESLDFNLEFKIRSESIFMQQMNFLTQIQKIESDLKHDDLYFLKNNLGKYLIQCTETYSRALKRHQTLLENPSLFKKQDNTLDSQKEKIDSEALKQVSLLEKELVFVKDNVINTINSDSFSDMRINTRFLEATVDHEETNSIVKLVTKSRQ